jgi:putative glycosyltransferase (TIGR04372 family)
MKIGQSPLSSYVYGHDRPLLKIISYLELIILIPTLGVAGFLLQRIISPILLIRVGVLSSKYLGHFLYEADLYFADEENYVGSKKLDLIAFQPVVSNIYLADKIRFILKIKSPHLVYPIFLVNRVLSPNSRYLKRFAKDFKLNDSTRLGSLPPSKLAQMIIFETSTELTDLDIEKSVNNLFILFLRTTSYRFLRKGALDSESSIYRDVSISDYNKLMSNLKLFGIPLILGYDAEIVKRLNLERIEVEKLNFGLCSQAKVSITTDSGSALIPFFLRKPIVQTNISMFGLIYGIPSNLILPKIYFDIEAGVKLTFRECLRRGIHEITSDHDYKKNRIMVISLDENTLGELTEEIVQISSQVWEASALNMQLMAELRSDFVKLYPILQYQTFPNFWVEKNRWFFQ